jgi:hypothetical protein
MQERDWVNRAASRIRWLARLGGGYLMNTNSALVALTAYRPTLL